LYVFGYCKSAGTLIALGADEIVMSDFGELGPLDIQLEQDDQLARTVSSLSYANAISVLRQLAFDNFEHNLLSIVNKSRGVITTKTAADIASAFAVGITAPIAGQIDPVKLGEVDRATNIANAYGMRICDDKARIERLVMAYPAHGFVIDFEEASDIFRNVRWANETELLMEKSLGDIVRMPQKEKNYVFSLKQKTTTGDATNGKENKEPRTASLPKRGRNVRKDGEDATVKSN